METLTVRMLPQQSCGSIRQSRQRRTCNHSQKEGDIRSGENRKGKRDTHSGYAATHCGSYLWGIAGKNR